MLAAVQPVRFVVGSEKQGGLAIVVEARLDGRHLAFEQHHRRRIARIVRVGLPFEAYFHRLAQRDGRVVNPFHGIVKQLHRQHGRQVQVRVDGRHDQVVEHVFVHDASDLDLD